jgi:hypothetical protein
MILTWELSENISNSIVEFLRNEVTASSLQLLDQNGAAKTVNVYAGRVVNNNWDMPLIQIYFDSNSDFNRLEIGSNLRLRSFQIIFDIRTLLSGQEANLAEWIIGKINNGVGIYDYTPNSLNPDVPAKSLIGHGRVDFISSLPVPLFDDADLFDKNRFRITIKVWLNG